MSGNKLKAEQHTLEIDQESSVFGQGRCSITAVRPTADKAVHRTYALIVHWRYLADPLRCNLRPLQQRASGLTLTISFDNVESPRAIQARNPDGPPEFGLTDHTMWIVGQQVGRDSPKPHNRHGAGPRLLLGQGATASTKRGGPSMAGSALESTSRESEQLAGPLRQCFD